MPFATVFGNQPVYSAQPQLLALALTADVELDWPLETAAGSAILATILDVTPNAGGRSITLPDARNGSPGAAFTFINLGAFTFTVENHVGGTVLTVASGEAWTLYLRTNIVEAGVWNSFQQGSGTSSANAASLAGAGLKAVSTTLNTKYEVSGKSVSYSIVEGDRAVVLAWTGGVGAFDFPDPSLIGSDWYVAIKNAGVGSLTLTPFGATTIDGSSSLILSTGESCFVYTDGVNFFTIGLGQEVNSVFDFISINAAGTGDLTLSGVQLNRVSYRFTGVLTGNRNIIVPASVQQYWVDNETTGAFTLTVKATGGDPGKAVTQNNRNILYCDGTNVLDAVSSAFTPPLAVGSGGTGATTAAAARANLGSTTVGDAVFIAVSAAAARSALGATSVGDAVFTAADAAAARTALGITGNVFTAYKSAVETKTNDITLANDTELFIAGLPANKAFAIEALIEWTQQGSTTNGFRGTLAGTGVGASTPGFVITTTVLTSAANSAEIANAQGYNNQLVTTVLAGGTAGQFMRITGTFVTGGGAGQIAFQWAQANIDGTGTRVQVGSWLKATQLN